MKKLKQAGTSQARFPTGTNFLISSRSNRDLKRNPGSVFKKGNCSSPQTGCTSGRLRNPFGFVQLFHLIDAAKCIPSKVPRITRQISSRKGRP